MSFTRQHVPVACVAAVASLVACSAWGAVVGSASIALDAALVDKPLAVSGRVDVNTSQAGPLEVTIDWVDNYGRVADRQVRVIEVPAQTSVDFSFPTDVGLAMLNQVVVRATFADSGDTLSGATRAWELVPDPIDHQDFHANVWGDGATSDPDYFAAIAQANVDLAHIYRQNPGFHGPTFNTRPNHDFIEDKKWFEMTDAMHDPNYAIYNPALTVSPRTYHTPAARAALIRPQSLSSEASLTSLINTIRPRMQATRKWRPMQWNIADEYGLGRRDYPFDYDLGPDSIARFITRLQGEYGTIEALNAQWGTHFAAWSELADPINAPQNGEAALIVTQEMKDREYPLYNADTAAKNFSPWSDFRRHMELTMAEAMQRCTDAARAIDTTVPIGWEGGETVSPLNGYDYWLQMRRMGSFEAYDLSNSPEFARSFRDNQYGEKLFRWVTMFDQGTAAKNRYRLWFGFLHYGFRASIIWSNAEFFTGGYGLSSYAQSLAPAYGEFRDGLAKLLSQAEPDDGQVALYYSQRTFHVSWMYDTETLGYSWLAQKSGDRRVQSMHYNNTGWLKALEDVGLKGRFVSYEQVAGGELIRRGYKVLIMPRTMAMSPEEIAAVQAFAEAGGVVIADSQAAIFDGHGRRRSIAEGGGLMDGWFGISRVNYRSTERGRASSSAYTGVPSLGTPPAGFEALREGLGASVPVGWYAVEDGVRVDGGTAVGLINDDPARPVLIVKDHGAGKSVYMNLTLMRYGRGGSNYMAERDDPASPDAQAVRQLVKNLAALGGVRPKVRVLQGYNADPASSPDVYNLEKARFVDGPIVYLGCIVNSQLEHLDWSTEPATAALLFGQAMASRAKVTLVLDEARHVYDVRERTYLGYGTRVNAEQPVLEGGAFALLPYRVEGLRFDRLTLDEKQRATLKVSVRTDGEPAARHVLRLEVLDAAGQPVAHLAQSVVAPGGVYEGVIPFAVSEDLSGWTIRVRDVASGAARQVRAAGLVPGDVDLDGRVDLWDLLALVNAFGSSKGQAGYNFDADLNDNGTVDMMDLLVVVNHWGMAS